MRLIVFDEPIIRLIRDAAHLADRDDIARSMTHSIALLPLTMYSQVSSGMFSMRMDKFRAYQ